MGCQTIKGKTLLIFCTIGKKKQKFEKVLLESIPMVVRVLGLLAKKQKIFEFYIGKINIFFFLLKLATNKYIFFKNL